MKKTRYLCEYALFTALLAVVRGLPRHAALALGRLLGGLMRLVLPRRWEKAQDNLHLAYPDMDAPARHRLLRENFRQLGISGVEMARLTDYHNERAVRDYFEIEGLEHLREAHALGRGVLILTGHVGFWEAGAVLLPMLGFPTDYIYKPVKNPYIDRYFLKTRERAGGRCIDKNRAARKIMRSLGEGRSVAVLIDQRVVRREGVTVTFFGRPANTTPVIAQLALKLGTPVVPMFSRRLPDNRYAIVAEPMLLFPREENPAPEAVIQATQLFTDRIEAAVRRSPEQWFWMHDRWRL